MRVPRTAVQAVVRAQPGAMRKTPNQGWKGLRFVRHGQLEQNADSETAEKESFSPAWLGMLVMVEPTGIEPVTSTLPVLRSPS